MWDLVIVGAGPAGAAAALGALAVDPGLSVLLVDRHDFPRDKTCGDGIAPHVFDLLAAVGVTGLVDDWTPVRRFVLTNGAVGVERDMARPNWVVPRAVFDQRLVAAAQTAGAQFVRRRVRRLDLRPGSLMVEDLAARCVIGADGAHSVVRRELGVPPGPVALAIRGYAPTPPGRAASQVIAYGAGNRRTPGPSIAATVSRTSGTANVSPPTVRIRPAPNCLPSWRLFFRGPRPVVASGKVTIFRSPVGLGDRPRDGCCSPVMRPV
ncbi:hypothetical protein GCM10029976_035310 [Kribbella albertanoniae]